MLNKEFIAGVLVSLVFILSLSLGYRNTVLINPTSNLEIANKTNFIPQSIKIKVFGAVNKPGTYYLSVNPPRVLDAVNAAGGLSSLANLKAIDLAEDLSKATFVSLPYYNQNKQITDKKHKKKRGKKNSKDKDSKKHRHKHKHRKSKHKKKKEKLTAGDKVRINPNTATIDDLMRFPGVGEALAQRIIDYRKLQPLTTPEDLLNIKGIGQKKLEKFREFLEFKGYAVGNKGNKNVISLTTYRINKQNKQSNPLKSNSNKYIQYFIASYKNATCTETSKCVPDSNQPSHDAVTRLLSKYPTDAEALWQEAKPLIKVDRGVLILNDSMLDNSPNGKRHRRLKGVDPLILLWSDGNKLIPADFKIYDKEKDDKDKNQLFLDMLDIAKDRGFKPDYIIFDSWYSSNSKNLKYIRDLGWRFITQVKPTRLVNPDKTGSIQVCEIKDIPEEGKTVRLRGIGFVKLFQILSKDSETEYWITNDLEINGIKRDSFQKRA